MRDQQVKYKRGFSATHEYMKQTVLFSSAIVSLTVGYLSTWYRILSVIDYLAFYCSEDYRWNNGNTTLELKFGNNSPFSDIL
eukprot:2460254-Amphidinium_carterae.1